MPYTPYRGTAGRVVVGTASVAGIDKWSLSKQVETVPSTNFESAADANNVIWETLLVGVGSATAEVEGTFDGDTINSEDRFPAGTQVTLDLLFDKATTFGYLDLPAVVVGINAGQDLRAKGTFKASFKINGAPAVA